MNTQFTVQRPRNIYRRFMHIQELNLCTVYTTSTCTFVIHIRQQTTIKLATSVHIDNFCMTEYILLSGVIVFSIQFPLRYSVYNITATDYVLSIDIYPSINKHLTDVYPSSPCCLHECCLTKLHGCKMFHHNSQTI